MLYLRQGLKQNALKEFQKAILIDPGSALAHHNLGMAYESQKQTDQAIQAYSDALRLDANLTQARYNLALCHLEQGQRDMAMMQQQQLAAQDPALAGRLKAILDGGGRP
jgi:Tfp pilus assembly protein PilF